MRIIVNVRQNTAGLCNGSTADSDSVCEGSNPSPAAKETCIVDAGLFFWSYHPDCSFPENRIQLKTQEKIKILQTRRSAGFSFLAAGEGFEPSHTESESAVLPLHNPATRKSYYTLIPRFVKSEF